MKIITTVCEPPGLEILRECFGADNVRCAGEAEPEFLRDAEVLVFLQWKPAKAIIKKMPKLRILQALSAGVDHVPPADVPEGVLLSSNSGSNAWAVAEHAFTLIMAALKKLPWRDRAMRRGEFPQLIPSRLLSGKTVAILGFGHIGQALAEMLQPFNVRILAINRSGKYEGPLHIEFIGTLDSLAHVLAQADIVVLTLPLTEETKGLIDRNALNVMKKNAILVNVARGKIINQSALYEFLKENEEFTAALDTWWHYGAGFRQDYPFETLENVILSPHCGGVYETWLEDAMRSACEKIKMRNDLIRKGV
ncbi:MAG: hydroxyacid dehydrogenase [Euryarchaeota archaeon]|nr:hydroxyacid dehydrogenase [Euryarchaeota archaeon]